MSNLTSLPLEDKFSTTLTQELSTTGLTINVAATPNFTFGSNTSYAVINPGKSTMEIVKISAYDDSALTITIPAGGRNQAQGASVTTTAQTHVVGSKLIISDNYAFWADIQTAVNSKVNTDSDTTISSILEFTEDDSGSYIRVTEMTEAVRDAIASPDNGIIIYNSTAGELQFYDGGTWNTFGTSSTSNASETVAGIVELATNAEMGSGTSTGGTGARLIPPNDQLVKTSSGAGDENKIAVLDSSGTYNAFVTALAGLTATVSELNQVCDGTTATAANLTTLTDGSDATVLHGHDPIEVAHNAGRLYVYDHFGYSGLTGGSATNNGGYVVLQTSAGVGFEASTQMRISDAFGSIYDTDPKWSALGLFSQTTDQRGYLGLIAASGNAVMNNISAGAVLTLDHAGFIIEDAAIYASVADGTTQEKSADLSGTYPITNRNTYYVEKSGSNYKFYINGNLVHTSTANEPNSTLSASVCGLESQATANKIMYVGQHMVSIDRPN